MISYVRPGAKLILTCQCSSYFGSGFGMVRLTLTGGATRGAITRAAQDNGFLSWSSCEVTLPSGATARVEESYYPGGDRDTTYIADLEKWRLMRRAHLTRLLHDRKVELEYAKLHSARKLEIETRLRAAIQATLELEGQARVRASGRSGGRARRGAVILRARAEDQRRLAAALASTYYVEVLECCNQAWSVDQGLDSREVRWEARNGFRQGGLASAKMPAGCEVALEWALTG
jgi:hypothetical protein